MHRNLITINVAYLLGVVPAHSKLDQLPDGTWSLDTLCEFLDPLRHRSGWREGEAVLDPSWADAGVRQLTLAEGGVYDQIVPQIEGMFDRPGYESFVQEVHDVLSESSMHRYHLAHHLDHPGTLMPHCDGEPAIPDEGNGEFPGGSYGRDWPNFNLTKWMTDTVMKPVMGGNANQSDGMLHSLMGMFAMSQVTGIIMAVSASIMEVVPPKIPPPFWILRPLPCMPLLTGINCLGSVLYPIPFPDFILGPVIDKAMIGHIDAFPQKYYERVGRTSDKRYQTCARAYLGLMCADTFHMCFFVPGQESKFGFPPCLPQCILTLLACPGFTMDDLMPQCAEISIPPLCSFSVFAQKVPPQIGSYEATHLLPGDCPPLAKASTTSPPISHGILTQAEKLVEAGLEGPALEAPLHDEQVEIVEPLMNLPTIRRVPKCTCENSCLRESLECPRDMCQCDPMEDTSSTELPKFHWGYGTASLKMNDMTPVLNRTNDTVDLWERHDKRREISQDPTAVLSDR